MENSQNGNIAKQVLNRAFGYSEFRPGQKEIIESLLSGRDTLAILPTGGGKSLCFQIPALIFPGLTVVISPLISLMGDQVSALKLNGISAECINSNMDFSEVKSIISAVRNGKIKLLYVAPERLATPLFQDLANCVEISFVCVDEAHCVSVWGHDFRPSYLDIRAFVDSLPRRPVVAAFTATATRTVQQDIIKLLNLHNPFFIETGYDRPNLRFEVLKKTQKEKPVALLKILENYHGKSGPGAPAGR